MARDIPKIYQIDEQTFRKVISENTNYRQVLIKFGMCSSGGRSINYIKKRVAELGLDVSHFNKYVDRKPNNHKYKMEEILVENSSYFNMARLKSRLVSEGYLEYKCYECGIHDWRGKKLSLHIEHKNGVNNDNRIENIIFLCPNCHSQTDTYAGKNKQYKKYK